MAFPAEDIYEVTNLETPRMRESSDHLGPVPDHGPTLLTERQPFIRLCGYFRPPKSRESKNTFPWVVMVARVGGWPLERKNSWLLCSQACGCPVRVLGPKQPDCRGQENSSSVSCILALSTLSLHFSLRLNNPKLMRRRRMRPIQNSQSVGTGNRLLGRLIPRWCSGGPLQPTGRICLESRVGHGS